MKLSLNAQIFIGAAIGIGAGIILGHTQIAPETAAPWIAGFSLLGNIFISLLKMIVAPLVLLSIMAGIANLGAISRLNRLWPILLIFFLSTTTIAIITGLTVSNIVKPGHGLDIELFKDQMTTVTAQSLTLGDFGKQLLDGLFVNHVAAMATNNILAIVVFGIFAGAGLIALGKRGEGLLKIVNEGFELMMVLITWLMRLAPFGIMGLLAKLVATQDMKLLPVLGSYMAVVTGTTLFHGIVTLPLILWITTRISPIRFFVAMKDAFVVAFATSSSNATLPVGLRCLTQNLKVDKNIAGFVLPVGATVNMDGTALYEAMAALFIANLCGIELNLAQQIIVALTAMVASIGAPGIPSAGMVTMIMVLQSVGLPVEAVAILIPIDRPLDTVRTVVNVEGDYIGSLILQARKSS